MQPLCTKKSVVFIICDQASKLSMMLDLNLHFLEHLSSPPAAHTILLRHGLTIILSPLLHTVPTRNATTARLRLFLLMRHEHQLSCFYSSHILHFMHLCLEPLSIRAMQLHLLHFFFHCCKSLTMSLHTSGHCGNCLPAPIRSAARRHSTSQLTAILTT